MSDSPDGTELSLVHKDPEPGDVDESLNEPRQQLAASDQHIAELERELEEAIDQEAETTRQLKTKHVKTAAADQQLREARVEATRLSLDEATQIRAAMIAEAEAVLETSRIEAERKASVITKQAFNQARETLAEAKREGEAIVDNGRENLRVVEADAVKRIAALDAEHRTLTQKLGVMETIYNELQETLQLVAKTSVQELAETQDSLKQLDPAATRVPLPESEGEDSASGSAPEEASVAELEPPPDPGSIDPAPVEIPPLPGR